MNVGKTLCEAGIPPPPALGVVTRHVAHVLDGCTEASWADHGAVGAGQAAGGDVVPAGMFEVLIQQFLDAGGGDAAYLIVRRFLHTGSGFVSVSVGGGRGLQLRKHRASTLCASLHQKAMPAWSEQFGDH